MVEHVEKLGLSKKTRRLLVGGTRAYRLLLTSDLLRWYLSEGLVVEKLYQVVEYTPVRCFTQFVNQVTAARRAGDADENKAVIADLR